MAIILIAGLFFLFFAVALIIGGRRRVKFNCDLCGRYCECVMWEGSKAAASHVCAECIKENK